MVKFASARRQAASMMKVLQGCALHSVGTVRSYEQALTRVGEWVRALRLCQGDLRQLTPALALDYLVQRGETVGQKTLDMERQAIQAMMQHVTGQMESGKRLSVIKSENAQILRSRAYTAPQVVLIAGAQSPRHALATEIAYAAGLRAHELLTLPPHSERALDNRPADPTKWQGRESELYTVRSKGGLVRGALLPHALAERLEARRLPEPELITDRGVHHQCHYAIGGGQPWSSSFSTAARRMLGWSEGAHGVRHSYAQERMHELQHAGLMRGDALRTVSQEMGHFRPEITETYLR